MKLTVNSIFSLFIAVVITSYLFTNYSYLFQKTPEELIASKLKVNVDAVSILANNSNGSFKSCLVEITNSNQFFLVMSENNYNSLVFKDMADQKATHVFYGIHSDIPNVDGYGVFALINKQRTPLNIKLLDQNDLPSFTHNTMTNEAFIRSVQTTSEAFDQLTPRIQTKFKEDITQSYIMN